MLEGRKADVILEDLQEIVQESNEGEEIYSEDERANEENNAPKTRVQKSKPLIREASRAEIPRRPETKT